MNRRDFVSRLALVLSLPPALYICSASAQVLQREDNNPTGLVLTRAQVELLANVCEAILPTTDTPGARDADVHGFIALLFAEWMTEAEQITFQKGMLELDRRLTKAADKPAGRIGDADMARLVAREAQVLEAPEASDYQAFFRQLRALTVVGYYTSEIGQKQELQVQFGAGQDTEVGPVVAKTYSI